MQAIASEAVVGWPDRGGEFPNTCARCHVVDPLGCALRIRLTRHPTELVVGHARALLGGASLWIALGQRIAETVVAVLPEPEIGIGRRDLSSPRIVDDLHAVGQRIDGV